LEEFWVKYQPNYPKISFEALKIFVQFSSTYLSESGFSSFVVIKTKHINRLDVESDLKCSQQTVSQTKNNYPRKNVFSLHINC